MEEKRPSSGSIMSKLCRHGCGFYGSAHYDDLCSRCYSLRESQNSIHHSDSNANSASAATVANGMGGGGGGGGAAPSSGGAATAAGCNVNVRFLRSTATTPATAADQETTSKEVLTTTHLLSGASAVAVADASLSDSSAAAANNNSSVLANANPTLPHTAHFYDVNGHSLTDNFIEMASKYASHAPWDSDNGSVLSSCSTTGATVGSSCSGRVMNSGSGAIVCNELPSPLYSSVLNAGGRSFGCDSSTTGMSMTGSNSDGAPSTFSMGALTRSSSLTSLLSTASNSMLLVGGSCGGAAEMAPLTTTSINAQGEEEEGDSLQTLATSSINTCVADMGMAATPPSGCLLPPQSSSSSSLATASLDNEDDSGSLSSSLGGVNTSSTHSCSPTPRKRKKRCSFCGKNVGLLGFLCRCGQSYCSAHRYANSHNCNFDYRESGRDDIRRNNPHVVSSKIRKI